MELTGKIEVLSKSRPNATLFTTNLWWTSLGSKSGSEARDRPLRSWSGQHNWCWHLFCMKKAIIWLLFLVFALSTAAVQSTVSHTRPVSAGNLLSMLSPQFNLPSVIEEFEVPISSLCSDLHFVKIFHDRLQVSCREILAVSIWILSFSSCKELGFTYFLLCQFPE
jgi:hypothetical protein